MASLCNARFCLGFGVDLEVKGGVIKSLTIPAELCIMYATKYTGETQRMGGIRCFSRSERKAAGGRLFRRSVRVAQEGQGGTEYSLTEKPVKAEQCRMTYAWIRLMTIAWMMS